jgi:very-short-patch-repair endonuclease
VGFRPHWLIGPYIVDFRAPRARLVAEVDGGYHAERAPGDARRDRWLEREGWRVMRLRAEQVLADARAAAAKVRAALG